MEINHRYVNIIISKNLNNISKNIWAKILKQTVHSTSFKVCKLYFRIPFYAKKIRIVF